MKMTTLILLILFVSGGDCDSHSLRYYHSGVSSPGSGLPEYSIVGYVDDREITNYNSDTHRCLPKVEWMKNLETGYWEEYTRVGQFMENESKHYVRLLMGQFNQTGGIHSFQRMIGCVLRDDGSTSVYHQIGYDGRELLYLDTQSWLYIPTMNEAQIITERWNKIERRGESRKTYLQNQCMQELKRIIEYGREDLEKIVRPEAKVWGSRQSDGATRLQCLVYGFHPRAVDVKWVKNGVDYVISYEITPILPHPDGTYQMKVSVEVPTTEEDTYACHVEHSSLGDETLIVVWDPNTEYKTNIPMIIGVVVAVVLLISSTVFGVIIFKRH